MRGVGRQQDLHFAIVPESLLGPHAILPAYTAMDDDDGLRPPEDRTVPIDRSGPGGDPAQGTSGSSGRTAFSAAIRSRCPVSGTLMSEGLAKVTFADPPYNVPVSGFVSSSARLAPSRVRDGRRRQNWTAPGTLNRFAQAIALLRKAMNRSSDNSRFTRDLESAFAAMHVLRVANKAPVDINPAA
jgi:hypothetical protein